MTSSLPRTAPTAIDPATEVGTLALSVADLERSLAYYTEAIGFTLLEREENQATLGVGGTPLLLLIAQPGAAPWPRGGRSYTGLYHFAILLPTRADLGRWLKHWFELGMPLPGQGDHLVSEALYLEDPDGHGIEVYRDRPRSEWTWVDGQVRMASDPVDLRGVLAEAEQEGKPWTGLPAGTKIGHIHLQVGDIPQAAAFYRDVLGFDIVAAMPTALFVSAGGYHHHIGMNTWHSRGATAAPPDSVNLRFFTVTLPTEDARQAVIGRAQAAGVPVEPAGEAAILHDPWGNRIALRVGTPARTTDFAPLLHPAG
jgi:catechol 2,3-dioxygenase